MHTNSKTYSYNNSSVRFRRYCRKAYAIFASLKINVTIGTLASYISDAGISKSHTTPFFIIKSTDDDFNEDENLFEENNKAIMLEQSILTYIKPVVSTPAVAVCAYINCITRLTRGLSIRG